MCFILCVVSRVTMQYCPQPPCSAVLCCAPAQGVHCPAVCRAIGCRPILPQCALMHGPPAPVLDSVLQRRTAGAERQKAQAQPQPHCAAAAGGRGEGTTGRQWTHGHHAGHEQAGQTQHAQGGAEKGRAVTAKRG